MAKETKPQSGTAATGAKIGDADRPELGREPGGTGERGGAREEDASDSPKRGPSETRPPGRRR